MFKECGSLISLPDISIWKTENVKNMKEIFYNCSSLTSLPDISDWNTGKVTNMSYMFNGCISLKEISNNDGNNIIKLKISKGCNTNNMYENCNIKIELITDHSVFY